MSDRVATASRSWVPVAAITLLAPAMGGSTDLWARALLLLAVGLVFLWAPPRVSPGWVWNLIFISLAAFSLAEFLPAAWFGLPEWRRTLVESYRIPLPATHSAQPWLSAEACCLFFGGLAWAYFLLAQTWTIPDRRKLVRFYGLGVAALAGLCLAAYWAQFAVPFWAPVGNSPINFGFFPNRNQTANVLALGAVMMTAVAYESSERRGIRGLLWLLPIALTCIALVIDFSRAGIVLFFGAAAIWLGCMIPNSRSKGIAALCLAAVVLMLAAFLLYGGDSLQRFLPEGRDNNKLPVDFRVEIQEDAVAFADQSPFFGQGLGNFEYLFPLFRQKSAEQNRALHPESDWLWVATELGWPAALIILIGIIYWVRECFPFGRDTDGSLRAAATICGVAFAIHGLADVSGHRAGALWPALFLCGIAVNPGRHMPYRAWVAPMFRSIGGAMMLVAAWWLASYWQTGLDKVARTSRTLARLRDQSDAAQVARDYRRVIATTTAALKIAPLDWRLYFQRATAAAVLHGSLADASRDFSVARFLSHQDVEPCFLEGEIWLALNQPEPASTAWGAALRRAGPDALPLYRRMLGDAPLNASILPALGNLAVVNRDFWIAYLPYSSPVECELQIGGLIAQDPYLVTLSRAQRKSLFATWYERGDRPFLISSLLACPEWMPDGWWWLARDYADRKKFQQAYQLAMRFTNSPAMPTAAPTEPINELERNFFYHSDDVHYGMDLYLAQRKLGQTKEALDTLLRLGKNPAAPAYVAYLQAELYAEQGDWEKAWDARLAYMSLPGG